MKKYENKNLGITLVALVITIIILLILAGISISTLTNTGIFQKAKEAKKAQKEKKRQQKNDTEHVYFHCPKCNQEMRAPKGKGKILVTCKNCGEKFEKTT